METSTRTSEGFSFHCTVCGKQMIVSSCAPLGDTVCPHCGALLYAHLKQLSKWRLPFDPKQFPWPAGWQSIPIGFEEESANAMGHMEALGTEEIPATNFVDELRREMCSLHPLFNRTFVPIACSTVDPDDVLYFTDDPDEPFAFVHLTWHTERTAAFPWCRTFPTIDAFIATCFDCG